MAIFHRLANSWGTWRRSINTGPAPTIAHTGIPAHVRRALAGELPITREPNPLGTGECLMIEPVPGHRIVVAPVRFGKSELLVQHAIQRAQRDS